MDIVKEVVDEMLKKCKMIAILRNVPQDAFRETVEALYKGGVQMMEVTFDQSRSFPFEETLNQINYIAEEYKGKILPGAGTVLDVEQVDMAHAAGALYIISPNVDESVIKRTNDHGLVSMPGALTPTEVANAAKFGADYVKVFPAGELGSSYIKSISAPLSNVKFLAVGKIDSSNMNEYMESGCVGVGVGGCLVNKKLIKDKDFEGLTQLAKKFTNQ